MKMEKKSEKRSRRPRDLEDLRRKRKRKWMDEDEGNGEMRWVRAVRKKKKI